MARALMEPCPLLTYRHTNALELGSVLHAVYEHGSQHLPKAQPTNNKAHAAPRLALLGWNVRKVNKRKITGGIHALSSIIKHRGSLPCAGCVGYCSSAQCDSP